MARHHVNPPPTCCPRCKSPNIEPAPAAESGPGLFGHLDGADTHRENEWPAPLRHLLRLGLLDGRQSLLWYGCGRAEVLHRVESRLVQVQAFDHEVRPVPDPVAADMVAVTLRGAWLDDGSWKEHLARAWANARVLMVVCTPHGVPVATLEGAARGACKEIGGEVALDRNALVLFRSADLANRAALDMGAALEAQFTRRRVTLDISPASYEYAMDLASRAEGGHEAWLIAGLEACCEAKEGRGNG